MKKTPIGEVLSTSSNNWNDWHWQMRQKPVCSNDTELSKLGIIIPRNCRRIGLTPYNVKLLLDLQNSNPKGFCAEMLQSFLPSSSKSKKHQWTWAKRHDLMPYRLSGYLPTFLRVLLAGKGSDTKVRALEKIYPETDIIIATATCARHCSFCFREVGDPQGEASRMTGNIEIVMNAVNKTIANKSPHVLVTGGDPLTRSNQQLKQILSPLSESETVEVLRLATRMIVDLPMRFYDKELLAALSNLAHTMKQRHASFRIVTHVNHPCELTSEAIKAIENIQACGIEVMNQTVVLRDVNDDIKTLQELLMNLDRLGVRNHKLFHTMPVENTEHLRIPIRKFRQLLAGLHQWLPGTSVPQANVVTLVGKIPVSPKGRQMISIPFTNRLLVRSFRGEWHIFKDVWDIGRHVREIAAAIIMITLLLAIIFISHQFGQETIVNQEQSQTVNRVAILADELDYPEAWARMWFKPYVRNHILYIPIQGINSKG